MYLKKIALFNLHMLYMLSDNKLGNMENTKKKIESHAISCFLRDKYYRSD